jgi:hypothetical protein
MLGLRSDLASFSAADDVLTVLATFLMCLVLFPMLADIGQALGAAGESRVFARNGPLGRHLLRSGPDHVVASASRVEGVVCAQDSEEPG